MFGKASLRPPRPFGYRRRPPTRLAVEQLEERTVPSTFFTVTNLNDDGPGSLRRAIHDANGTGEPDAIAFQPGLAGPITLTSGELDVMESVTITGPGAGVITVSGNNASRIFLVENAAHTAINVAISGLTLTAGSGGAVAVSDEVLALRGVVIANSSAQMGGGILVSTDGRLTLEDSTVSGNRADGVGSPFGGGLYLGPNSVALVRNSTISGNQAVGGDGGGVFVESGGSLTVENSTISGNSADLGGGIDVIGGLLTVANSTISGNSAVGGGGLLAGGSTLTVENSTISGNVASGPGGGISLPAGGTAVIRNSTVAFNTATSGGGGVFVKASSSPAAVTLLSTIVADNAVGAAGDGPDVLGKVTAAFSLVENVAGTTFLPGSANNVLGVDPLLGPLADNGGPTRTHALLAGSLAINHGANPAGLAFDQRGPGFARARGAAPDIGAFEAAPAPQIVAVPFRRNGVARVRVFDAAAGTVRAILTPFRGFRGRLRLQFLDVNGDGSLDLIVQAVIHGRRKKKLFDAVTLALLPAALA
jgi:hypothetical protein